MTRFFRVAVAGEPLIDYDDTPVPGRRSRNLAANLAARERLAEKIRDHHHDAEAARLVRLETVRRAALDPAAPGARPRRRAVALLLRHPASLHAWRVSAATLAARPRGWRRSPPGAGGEARRSTTREQAEASASPGP